ncbi:MAG: holo-ACP synthase [Naasia sp.]|uniref:holo-ACP synthase n=1 Tax=Naasia sp. TaxID=2546198 RepID=UPI00262D5EE4|nr:holo-ACP synthase [Naasia sp.]MCU1569632.1 holo-ACP synthase [Naasia sp.]
MIIGIGVDMVDIARFERAVARTPALEARLFADSERGRSTASLAARFAAKEALIKAVGDSTGFRWHDMVVVADDSGNPSLAVSGEAARVLSARGITDLHLSLSHDGGVACAFVIAESRT